MPSRALLARLAAAVALLAVPAAALLAAPDDTAKPAAPGEVRVFAAASLKGALDEIAAAWSETTGGEAVIACAGTSALARQIEEGAPADLFISANAAWMDHVEALGLVEPEARVDLLSNRLVLVAHDPHAPRAEIAPGFDLSGRLGDGRLAMALVDAVPAGIYGKAALERLGVWEAVSDRVAQADNVRAALAFVALGEAPYGIVYASDAAAEPGATVVGYFPEESHPRIVYPAARLEGAENDAAARDFLDHLGSEAAGAAFRRWGFDTLVPAPPGLGQ